jgi:hypothetical protein
MAETLRYNNWEELFNTTKPKFTIEERLHLIFSLIIFLQVSVTRKGVPGLECQTVGWLVSPAEGRQFFFWNPPVTGPQKANLRYLD